MPRQSPLRGQILGFIVEYHEKNGKTPTVRQLAAEFHKSLSTIHWHLCKLAELGLIVKTRYHRIELVK